MENEIIKHAYEDKTLPIATRKADYKSKMDIMMNPVPIADFNPKTFEPYGDDMKAVSGRIRVAPPKLLPTFGMLPKEIREGQMIGMYESKQDIYLILAHRCNELQAEIDLLKNSKK